MPCTAIVSRNKEDSKELVKNLYPTSDFYSVKKETIKLEESVLTKINWTIPESCSRILVDNLPLTVGDFDTIKSLLDKYEFVIVTSYLPSLWSIRHHLTNILMFKETDKAARILLATDFGSFPYSFINEMLDSVGDGQYLKVTLKPEQEVIIVDTTTQEVEVAVVTPTQEVVVDTTTQEVEMVVDNTAQEVEMEVAVDNTAHQEVVVDTITQEVVVDTTTTDALDTDPKHTDIQDNTELEEIIIDSQL